MKSILSKIALLFCLFFATWYLLNKIDWMQKFNIKENTESIEVKFADLVWKSYINNELEITEGKGKVMIDSILKHLQIENNIEDSSINIHLIESNILNAFALPNSHIIINTELYKECKNADELAGVIAHELAHVQQNHVTKKLAKEIGLSVMVSIVTGKGGFDKLNEIVRFLSSSAYDRSLESEADQLAVTYLENAKIDPMEMANFLYRLSEENNNNYLIWLSSHPDSKERAKEIIETRNKEIIYTPFCSKEEWIDSSL
jgi:beta-barrel assembly-enhancing protease